MNEVIEYQAKNEGFLSKHGEFFSKTFTVSLWISVVLAIIELISETFSAAQDGNIAMVVFNFLFMTLLISLKAFIGAAVLGSISVVLLFIPYLIVRGLRK